MRKIKTELYYQSIRAKTEMLSKVGNFEKQVYKKRCIFQRVQNRYVIWLIKSYPLPPVGLKFEIMDMDASLQRRLIMRDN